MGVMDKFLNAMKLTDEDNDGFYDEEDGDYLDDPEPIRKPAPAKEEAAEEPGKKVAPKVSSIKSTKKTMGTTGMEVCVIKPTVFEDAMEITQTLLYNRTVVLNLEGLDVNIAQRILDFTSGSCFAIQGNLQKISHYIFIITPKSVDISGDFQEIFGNVFDVSSGL